MRRYLILSPNRTRVELKLAYLGATLGWLLGPNRTRVELKPRLKTLCRSKLTGPNRTRVELKHRLGQEVWAYSKKP